MDQVVTSRPEKDAQNQKQRGRLLDLLLLLLGQLLLLSAATTETSERMESRTRARLNQKIVKAQLLVLSLLTHFRRWTHSFSDPPCVLYLPERLCFCCVD